MPAKANAVRVHIFVHVEDLAFAGLCRKRVPEPGGFYAPPPGTLPEAYVAEAIASVS